MQHISLLNAVHYASLCPEFSQKGNYFSEQQQVKWSGQERDLDTEEIFDSFLKTTDYL